MLLLLEFFAELDSLLTQRSPIVPIHTHVLYLSF